MPFQIVRFDAFTRHLLPQVQEPFEVIGRLIPTYDGHAWSLREELFDTPRIKTYPNEAFDPAVYIDNPDEAAFLAMCDGKRVGSIRVGVRWNQNAFIDDLLVARAHRGCGAGTQLMDAAVAWGRGRGLQGVSLETQDTNLLACRFYMKYGFRLGGIDRMVYTAEGYREETALYFYL